MQSDRLSYHSDISPVEQFWVDQQPFLLAHGYRLRLRYDPAWVPSWKRSPEKAVKEYEAEDATRIWKPNVLDATQIRDGARVVLKRVHAIGDEVHIALHLSSPQMRSDFQNRAVPILEVIPIHGHAEDVFLVMPFLREFHSPPFHCRAEFIEALRQYLQGLEFMHEQNIVHGDACLYNLMMDESRVIPKGSHFAINDSHDGSAFNLTWRHRCSVAPVDYYYIDFGLSGWFPDGKETAARLGVVGQVKKAPELSDTVPYNPFHVDIYQLGYTVLEVIKIYRGLQMFVPLGQHMTRPNPADRPTASVALAEFEAIASSIKRRKMNTRIWRDRDTVAERFVRWVFGFPIL